MRKILWKRYVVKYEREIHKSVRMDERIYNYIMQFDGRNFTDKLENLVINHAELTGHLADVGNGRIPEFL